jgi:hypothetical protein
MRWRIFLVSGFLASVAFAFESARYLRWNEIKAPVPDLTVTDSKQWDGWVRQRDFEIRAGIDRYIDDSISMLIMFGTSFTSEARLVGPADTVTAAGGLTPAARLRMEAFIEGLDRLDDERFRSILQFLRRRQISQEELRAYLSGNLRRAALERAHNQHSLSISLRSSLIEQTLRGLINAGKSPAHIRRIGVIGPGFDPEYDPDTYNLFGSLEGALSSGLAKPGNVEVLVLDVNPWVLTHVRAVAGKSGARYSAKIRAVDLDVVTQTLETGAGQGFDLMILNASLGGYSPLEQSLVLANVAQMMASGGVFLISGAASVPIPQEFEAVGGATDAITVYRRR